MKEAASERTRKNPQIYQIRKSALPEMIIASYVLLVQLYFYV